MGSYRSALKIIGIELPETNEGDVRAAYKLIQRAGDARLALGAVVYKYIAGNLLRGNERHLIKKQSSYGVLYIRNLIDFVDYTSMGIFDSLCRFVEVSRKSLH